MGDTGRMVLVSDARGLASLYLLPAHDAEGKPFRREAIKSAANHDKPALLLGETGTGKEQLARLLHEWGPRKEAPFVPVDCSTLGGEGRRLSELFGWRKGAFTGADADHPGLLDEARNGTIFLDEIANLDVGSQRELLRFLESGEYRPLGSDRRKCSAARVVGATNKPLATGKIRETDTLQHDVAARFPLRFHLPPLRERGDDVFRLMLMPAFLDRSCIGWITPRALLMLALQTWPDNMRGLRRVVRSMPELASDAPAETLEGSAVLDEVQGVELPSQYDLRITNCADRARALAGAAGLDKEAESRIRHTQALVDCLRSVCYRPPEAIAIPRLESILRGGRSDYAPLNLAVDKKGVHPIILMTGAETMVKRFPEKHSGTLLDVILECAEAVRYGLSDFGLASATSSTSWLSGDSFIKRSPPLGPDIERRNRWADFDRPRPLPDLRTTDRRKWPLETIDYVRRLRAAGETPATISAGLEGVITSDQAKEILRTYGDTFPSDRPKSKGGRPRSSNV